MRAAPLFVVSLLFVACSQGASTLGDRGAGVDLGGGGSGGAGSDGTSDDWAARERSCDEPFAPTAPTYRAYRMDIDITPTATVPPGVTLETEPAPFHLIFNEADESIYVATALGATAGGIGVESLDPLRFSRLGALPLRIAEDGSVHDLELPRPFEIAAADLDGDGTAEGFSGTLNATYRLTGTHEELPVDATIVLTPESGLPTFAPPAIVAPTDVIRIPGDRFVIADGGVHLLVDGVEMYACAGAVNAPLNEIAVIPYQPLPWGAELELEVGVVDLEGNASTLQFAIDVIDAAPGTPDLGFENGTRDGYASLTEAQVVDASTGIPMDGQHALIVQATSDWGVGFEVDVPQTSDPVLTFTTRSVTDSEVAYQAQVTSSAMAGNSIAPGDTFYQSGGVTVLTTPLQFPAGASSALSHVLPAADHRLQLDGFQGQRAVVWIGSTFEWHSPNVPNGNAAVVIDDIRLQ